MAAEISLSSLAASSPRISFSHDLSPTDRSVTVEDDCRMDTSLLMSSESTDDFDFSLSRETSLLLEPSSADELFSDGKLLPQPIRTSSAGVTTTTATVSSAASTALQQGSSSVDDHVNDEFPVVQRKRESLREVMAIAVEERRKPEEQETTTTTATISDRRAPSSNLAHRSLFWRFRRSSSVGDNGTVNSPEQAGVFCPFLLSRSKSVGCRPNQNPIPIPRRRHFTKFLNNNHNNNNGASSSWGKTYYYSANQRSSTGYGINPVINVPAPFFSRVNSSSSSNNNSSSNGSSSFIGYLLCSCSSKGMRKAADMQLPALHNGKLTR